MHKDKRSSVMYHEWYFKYASELTLEEFGLIFKAIACYGQYGEEPGFEDRGLRLIWNDIKTELDKNRASWEHTCEVKRQNGKKGGRPKKTQENPMGSDGLEEKPNETEENRQLSEVGEEKPTETYRFLNGENKTYENMNNEYMSNEYMNIPPYNPPTGGNPSLCKNVIDYLNEKTGKSYKPSSRKTQDLIKARFKEGFTEEDFKTVIDKKTSAWLNDSKMNQYLRPETLFGTKFEGYLNEQPPKPKITPFQDFSQRNYDWKSLEGDLLAK